MELLELVLGDVDEYLDDSNATEDATLVHVHVEEQFDILRSDDGLCKRQNGLVWRRRWTAQAEHGAAYFLSGGRWRTHVAEFEVELDSGRLPEWSSHAEKVQMTGTRDGDTRRKREEIVAVAHWFA